MFTRNWYKAISRVMTGQNVKYKSLYGMTRTTSSYVEEAMKIGLSGNATMNRPSLYTIQTSLGSSAYAGVVLGTGTTQASIDDYKLSGSLISSFSYSAGVVNTTDDSGTTLTASYTITNTGSEAFTIGEIGLVCNPEYASTNYNDQTYKTLLERTVLETPLTIEAGGVGVLTYTIHFNFPTA